jgi:Na+-translocating ferredoxin:NAD+ oxidoreductase RNF subunit RnfB
MKPPFQPGRYLILSGERCHGCTHCMRVCPTEAIRIRHGKAEVISHRCIGCGKCIPACPREAWGVQSISLKKVKSGGKAVAILDPAVFWQFGGQTSPQRVMEAFLELGFIGAKDGDESLKIYGAAVSHYLSSEDKQIPAIASACPAVVQLAQVKYPSLLENLVPVVPPWEIAARLFQEVEGKNSDLHLYYITPCLARAEATAEPFSSGRRYRYHGAIPLAAIYNPLKSILAKGSDRPVFAPLGEPALSGMRWAAAGGESQALGMGASLMVEGIDRVAMILELAESGLLAEVPFIEAWACPAGCLGGSLTVQDPFLARYHLMAFLEKKEVGTQKEDRQAAGVNHFRLEGPLHPRPGLRLDDDLKQAMKKLGRIDEILKRLPRIDCGSCGCPTCLAFAEDIVQGYAVEGDCCFVSRGKKWNRSKTMEMKLKRKRAGKF